MIRLLVTLVLLPQVVLSAICGYTTNFNASEAPIDCTNVEYENTLGTAVAAIGNSESRNDYRGVYYTGENIKICKIDVKLHYSGNIDAIDYVATVRTVDPDDLSFGTLVATSTTVDGADIVEGWNTFTFAIDGDDSIPLISGKTMVLISRLDVGTNDGSNYLEIDQEYDESDSISWQWNTHYYDTGVIAGRGAGDEDQPEYYAIPWRFYGSEASLSGEAPNIPENINVTATNSTTINIEWTERGEIAVDHYNVYEYNYSTGAETLLGTSPGVASGTQDYDHTGLTSGTTHYYVVRAVTSAGVEGWHSLSAHNTGAPVDPDWVATTP